MPRAMQTLANIRRLIEAEVRKNPDFDVDLGQVATRKSVPDANVVVEFGQPLLHGLHAQPGFKLRELTLSDLQGYVVRRARDKGKRGPLNPVTIKEIVTLPTAWNWGVRMGMIVGRCPAARSSATARWTASTPSRRRSSVGSSRISANPVAARPRPMDECVWSDR